ncbi:hypothetical protein Tco_1148908 [Tanacetum coccineum]
MAELKNLRYGTNMKEYQSQFEQLLTQKYVPGHKCEGQVFTLEIRGTGVEEYLEEEEEEESDMISYELSDPTPQTLPLISLNALSRIPTHN